MKKIAFPLAENNTVEEHFGHCQKYLIASVDNNVVKNKEIITIEGGCACKSNLVEIFKNNNVNVLIVNSIGENAISIFNYYGIEVFKGCKGNIDELIESYLNKKLKDSNVTCSHHDNCNHS
ncbi:MAG: hypothetical protein A2X12_03300 [Bacteroidetes bacterium GWE2_29_8]|nr:MAG: hypothetical protein A2X12_03300 [Bacteroidetes bacterium GWE2_29_8]OFY14136.1 MAG: hypothetical protein A2X02_02575 [Bacteroidetes bacterium GWF2_29_10]